MTQSIKYSYFYLIQDFTFSIVHAKYKGDEQEYRSKAIQKLSFDFMFFSCSSFLAYYWFYEEDWFPNYLGGRGYCYNIYKNYPNWPNSSIAPRLETFYMLQLGIHIFSIFESVAIRRKHYRKYYEFLLHHFIATTLILFSLLTNMLPVGVVILFLCDISDMATDVIRVYVETKYRHKALDVSFFLLAALSWFYTRILVFPCCAIWQIYLSLPRQEDEWNSIWFEHLFLLLLNCVLVAMQCYWWVYLVLAGVRVGKG